MKSRILLQLAAFLLLFAFVGCSDPCDNTTCLNSGACMEGECICPEGYSGPQCEIRDLCRGGYCLNGRYCADGACICPTGYTGANYGITLTPVGVKIEYIENDR